MLDWENPEDRAAIAQLNTSLRHAQLELLSAECASDQLRLRFSAQDIARYAQQDVLHKASRTATALHSYYCSLTVRSSDSSLPNGSPKLKEEEVRETVARISSYMREQREHYYQAGSPLRDDLKAVMAPFFSPTLLSKVRMVELKGSRMPNPPLHMQMKAMGFANFPEFRHMASVTFYDVVVFNETASERDLFHALVHVVQCQVLGPEAYCELFLRGFVKTLSHYSVPLEAHAFALESRFAAESAGSFSVEEQVERWAKQGRY